MDEPNMLEMLKVAARRTDKQLFNEGHKPKANHSTFYLIKHYLREALEEKTAIKWFEIAEINSPEWGSVERVRIITEITICHMNEDTGELIRSNDFYIDFVWSIVAKTFSVEVFFIVNDSTPTLEQRLVICS